MPYFINESTDSKPVYQQIKDLKLWDSRVVTINPVPNDWSDAQVIKYLKQEKIRERKIRVLFVLSYWSHRAADYRYEPVQFEEEQEYEAVTQARYDFFLRTSIKKFRYWKPDDEPNTQTQFYILLDPPSTTNFTLPALPASQPEAKVVRAPAKKESQTLALGDTGRLYSMCCKGVMMQCQKLPILLLIHTHPLQEALKSLLVVGWSVSALADPQGENPWTLLSLLAPAAAFLYSYRSIPLHRARFILLDAHKQGRESFYFYGPQERKIRAQALFESLQVGLMAYALFTRSALSPCLSIEEGLPLPQVPQQYFIPLFLSIFLGLVRMSHLLFSKIERTDNAVDVFFDSFKRLFLYRRSFFALALLLRLPAPWIFDAFSVGCYLSPLLQSLIPFLATYCFFNSLIPAFFVAAAHMAFERELFYSDARPSSGMPGSRGLARYPLYPIQWLLDAMTHTTAAVIGFFFDPIITMGALKVLGQVCVGWMLGEFWRIYLTPYMPMNVQLDVLPYVTSAIGLFSGITDAFSHLVYIKDEEITNVYTETFRRYQLFFSKHTGDIVDAFYLRYLEHALSVGKWINDVTKATGKMLGCYRPKQGVGFFCCDGSGASASEATVVMMDDPVDPAVDYGTRTRSSSQEEEAVTKLPHSFRDFFKAGAKELGALCGERKLPVAAR